MINVTELLAAFSRNGFQCMDVVCPDGAVATVTPCSYNPHPRALSDIDYWLVDCDLPWLGGSSIEEVVDQLNRHASLIAEQEREIADIRDYFDSHQASGWDGDSWDFYSDWHKDVFGYRPHGYVCGEYVRPY